MSEKTYSVLCLFPLWRYAVCPTNGFACGIPYYRYSKAKTFFEETKKHLPWAGCVLLKRYYFQGVEVIEEHKP